MLTRERLARWLDQAETPMLGLAVVAVLGYLLELAGVIAAFGLTGPWRWIELGIDVAFVTELVMRSAVHGATYLRSPWFLVDAICAVPILASLNLVPSVLQGLRFVRAIRVLRVLRTLRGLRALRILRFASRESETIEQLNADRVVKLSVVGYAVVFLALAGLSRDPSAARLVRSANANELFLVLGSLLGMILVLVVARQQIPALWSSQMRALLNVALPRQVADYLMKHPAAYDRTIRAPATVIFCDLKGFTASVEIMSLEEVKAHLEAALDAVVKAHVRQDLIVDKFMGDAVMSFRGGDLVSGDPAEHAYRVVRAALDSIRALDELGDPHFREIKVGGASATDALIGAFGTSNRLSYTVLGDRVNLAARLEGSCNALGVRNLFCDLTHELIKGRSDLIWRRVGTMKVQGKELTTPAWEVFEADPRVAAWIAVFHEGLAAYETRDFATAGERFSDVDRMTGGDALSRQYAARCAEVLEGGLPEGWSAVLTTRK